MCMYVCVCVCVCVWGCAALCVSVELCVWVCSSVCERGALCVYVYVCERGALCMCVHLYVCVCVWACSCVCEHGALCMCVCECTSVCVCVCECGALCMCVHLYVSVWAPLCVLTFVGLSAGHLDILKSEDEGNYYSTGNKQPSKYHAIQQAKVRGHVTTVTNGRGLRHGNVSHTHPLSNSQTEFNSICIITIKMNGYMLSGCYWQPACTPVNFNDQLFAQA